MIHLEVRNRVATLVLDRPPVNALDDGMVARLEELIGQVASDPDVAALLLRSSSPRVFCAGADIRMIEACLGSPDGIDRMLAFVEDLQRTLARLEALPLPTVVALEGAATAGGLELALACDLRVAGESTRVGLTETRIGLLPGGGGTQRLTAVAGKGVASRLVLTGELVDGRTAAALGVVQQCVPDGEAAEVARELAGSLAGLPRAALAASKKAIALAPSAEGFRSEVESTRTLLEDAETTASVRRFFASR